MKNSLIKMLNGGIPTIARPPIKTNMLVRGITFMTPLISEIVLVSYFWLIVPLAKNISGFVIAWFTMCRIAP